MTYGFFTTKYVECKNYSGAVPLKDVAKFKTVLELNNIPLRNGIFITTSTYVPRATTIGIRTVDGDQLLEMEKKAIYVRMGKYLNYFLILSFLVFSFFLYLFDIDSIQKAKHLFFENPPTLIQIQRRIELKKKEWINYFEKTISKNK